MATRAETQIKPWVFEPIVTPKQKNEKENIDQKVYDLAKYLDGDKPDNIRVNSVIPSTSVGILMNFTMSRIVATTEDGEQVIDSHTTDLSTLSRLAQGLVVSKKEERDTLGNTICNVNIVKRFLKDASNWGPQFNTGRDS